MKHPSANLNIKDYREVQKSLSLVEEPLVALHTDTKGIMKNVSALLAYKGVEDLQIPGSFLGVVSEITGLSITHIIAVLDISKSTFYRVKDEEQLERNTIDKLASLFKIYNRGIKTFGGKEDFLYWLKSKITTLGNKMPLDLVKTENGRSTVLDAIDRVEYGVYG